MVSPNEDYYAWTQETIEKLRRGRLSEVSMEDLIEELEDMGRSERRTLKSRLAVLLGHLLKWQYQPERRGRSWRATIKVQRNRLNDLLKDNPSLRSQLQEFGATAYLDGIQLAIEETSMDEGIFPPSFKQTGWTWEQMLDTEFYPD